MIDKTALAPRRERKIAGSEGNMMVGGTAEEKLAGKSRKY
jgi:hypothetical protein